MDKMVIDVKKRFDLSSSNSLRKQIEGYFGEPCVRIMTQLDMFPGFDELAVLMKSGLVHRCLVTDGVQVSDWVEVEKGEQR